MKFNPIVLGALAVAASSPTISAAPFPAGSGHDGNADGLSTPQPNENLSPRQANIESFARRASIRGGQRRSSGKVNKERTGQEETLKAKRDLLSGLTGGLGATPSDPNLAKYQGQVQTGLTGLGLVPLAGPANGLLGSVSGLEGTVQGTLNGLGLGAVNGIAKSVQGTLDGLEDSVGATVKGLGLPEPVSSTVNNVISTAHGVQGQALSQLNVVLPGANQNGAGQVLDTVTGLPSQLQSPLSGLGLSGLGLDGLTGMPNQLQSQLSGLGSGGLGLGGLTGSLGGAQNQLQAQLAGLGLGSVGGLTGLATGLTSSVPGLASGQLQMDGLSGLAGAGQTVNGLLGGLGGLGGQASGLGLGGLASNLPLGALGGVQGQLQGQLNGLGLDSVGNAASGLVGTASSVAGTAQGLAGSANGLLGSATGSVGVGGASNGTPQQRDAPNPANLGLSGLQSPLGMLSTPQGVQSLLFAQAQQIAQLEQLVQQAKSQLPVTPPAPLLPLNNPSGLYDAATAAIPNSGVNGIANLPGLLNNRLVLPDSGQTAAGEPSSTETASAESLSSTSAASADVPPSTVSGAANPSEPATTATASAIWTSVDRQGALPEGGLPIALSIPSSGVATTSGALTSFIIARRAPGDPAHDLDAVVDQSESTLDPMAPNAVSALHAYVASYAAPTSPNESYHSTVSTPSVPASMAVSTAADGQKANPQAASQLMLNEQGFAFPKKRDANSGFGQRLRMLMRLGRRQDDGEEAEATEDTPIEDAMPDIAEEPAAEDEPAPAEEPADPAPAPLPVPVPEPVAAAVPVQQATLPGAPPPPRAPPAKVSKAAHHRHDVHHHARSPEKEKGPERYTPCRSPRLRGSFDGRGGRPLMARGQAFDPSNADHKINYRLNDKEAHHLYRECQREWSGHEHQVKHWAHREQENWKSREHREHHGDSGQRDPKDHHGKHSHEGASSSTSRQGPEGHRVVRIAGSGSSVADKIAAGAASGLPKPAQPATNKPPPVASARGSGLPAAGGKTGSDGVPKRQPAKLRRRRAMSNLSQTSGGTKGTAEPPSYAVATGRQVVGDSVHSSAFPAPNGQGEAVQKEKRSRKFSIRRWF